MGGDLRGRQRRRIISAQCAITSAELPSPRTQPPRRASGPIRTENEILHPGELLDFFGIVDQGESYSGSWTQKSESTDIDIIELKFVYCTSIYIYIYIFKSL